MPANQTPPTERCPSCRDDWERADLRLTPVHPALGAMRLCPECSQLIVDYDQKTEERLAREQANRPRGGRPPGRQAEDPESYRPLLQPVLNFLSQQCREAGYRGAPTPTFPQLAEALNQAGLLTSLGVGWSSENLFGRCKKLGFDRADPYQQGLTRHLLEKQGVPIPQELRWEDHEPEASSNSEESQVEGEDLDAHEGSPEDPAAALPTSANGQGTGPRVPPRGGGRPLPRSPRSANLEQ